ncbi:hypothetical protein, partial [Methylomagnum sp.]
RALYAEQKRAERKEKALASLSLDSLYTIDAGRICKAEGEVPAPLCNFTAKIEEEVLIDDGENTEMVFAITGRLCTGVAFPRIEVPAASFAGMAWVTGQWGIRAIINAANSSKEHLRAAMQELSGNVPRRTVYAHIGWRQLDGEWRYLHAGGALGATGNRADIEVNPGPGNMAHYRFPDPPTGAARADAIKASLELFHLAPQKPGLGALLLAIIYRAPLGAVALIDHAAWVAGYTGARKSEATAMALAHFGQDFTSRTFPASWVDSPGVLELKAHVAKDAIYVVDDFKPQGSKSDIDALHGKADRLIRGVGNQAGRGRLQANMKQRATYHPRGFVLATGEDIPRGQSLRARMTVQTVSRDPHDPRKGDIDLDRLTRLQGHARTGTLARAMAGYLCWLAPQLDQLKASIPDQIRERRDQAARRGLAGHSRGPSDYASLTTGLTTFVRYAVESGALTQREADDFTKQAETALWALMEDQGEHQSSQDDVTRFLSLLASALSSGRCHVFDLDGDPTGRPTNLNGHASQMLGWAMGGAGEYYPKGPRIGWIEGDTVYFDGDATYSAATEYARDQGGNIEVTQRTIFERIYERGFLSRTETEKASGKLRLQVRKTVCGTNKRLYALRLSVLCEE